MDHPEGAGLQRADRVDFDPRVRLEFRGTQLSSDGGLLVMRELDDALGLSDLASAALRDTRSGKNMPTQKSTCSAIPWCLRFSHRSHPKLRVSFSRSPKSAA